MKIEDDIFGGKHIWYCLETNDDTLIAVARIAFCNANGGEENTTADNEDIADSKETSEQPDRCAVVKNLYFSSGLFTEETARSVFQSFLVQLETTAFHMNARSISIQVEDTQEAAHALLNQRGYEDSSGYLLEGTSTMLLSFSKSLSLHETDADHASNEPVLVENEAQNAIAALMPDLFSALHKEYNV